MVADLFGSPVSQMSPTSDSYPLKGLKVSPKTESSVLKLKGLPYTATKQHIVAFFHPLHVLDVHFVYEPDGRPSGLAFAEFTCQADALKALERSGKYIKKRYVKLLLVPKQEMEDQTRFGTLAVPGPVAQARIAKFMGKKVSAQLEFSKSALLAQQLWQSQMYSFLPPAALPGLYSLTGSQQPSSFLQSPAEPPLLPSSAVDYLIDPGFDLPSNPFGLIGSPAFMAPPNRVYIRGLPYKTTEPDVLQFFAGYEPIADTLVLRKDILGRFTGEAWVSFASAQKAVQAVQERNGFYLRNRYLELSLG